MRTSATHSVRIRWRTLPIHLACVMAAWWTASTSLAADAGKATPPPLSKAEQAEKRTRERALQNAIRALTPTTVDGRFLKIDLTAGANDTFAAPLGKGPLTLGDVPFQLPQGEKDHLSLRQAKWKGWERDVPFSKEHPYPSIPNDPEMPTLRVPLADYVAAHVLAVADDDPELAPAFTLRMGTVRPGTEMCQQFDFAGQVPRRAAVAQAPPGTLVKTAGQTLCYIRVPLNFAFAQDLDPARSLDIEITKEVRLARRNPDPNRYRWRPLGLPSGVRIAAMTLEKSPLQMRVTSAVPAHAFEEPQTPTFSVQLTNVSTTPQGYTLAAEATHWNGAKLNHQASGEIAPGAAATVAIPWDTKTRGYYDLTVKLSDGTRRELLTRSTSFALLPADTRKHRAESPFGTYDWGGGHATCSDMEIAGPLYVKLGLRYGMFNDRTGEARAKFGLEKGNDPNIVGKTPGLEAFEKARAGAPDLDRALLFHETSVSKRSVTRVPDFFTGRPPYEFDAEEAPKFKALLENAIATARAMREKYPQVKLALGNGTLPMKELLLREKFPPELFDELGNESGSYSYSPETQPPMSLGNNASLWMDRQLLDAYGYKDKPVYQCHEVCYPGTNPGNLDLRTQADYFVRHAMHSLAWGVPSFRPGILMDVGIAYRFSHWGATGFCHAMPEMNVKPSFVSFATMTRVLDGAKFVRAVPLGSPSLYGVEWAGREGERIFVLWTLRGQRPVELALGGEGWRLIDDQANETPLATKAGKGTVTLTPSPCYVLGKGQLTAAAPGLPTYSDKPEGKVSALSSLATLDDWTMETGQNLELEYYNFLTPRRKGDFEFATVPSFEGQTGGLRITPRPITTGKDVLPMYAVLAHKTGISLPGRPTEIGLTINGNSGWGRVIFELTDASGQRWISLGGPQRKTETFDPASFLPADVRERMPAAGICDWCTDDGWDQSRINFDGWRYVSFPMPGNYPGEHYGWPGLGQWRWDKDGVVHYPLKLTKLVVELREKVLHLQTFAPPPRPEIYVKDLLVAEGDTVRVKHAVPE